MNNNYNNDRARGGSNNSYGSGFADDSFSGYNDYSGNTFGGNNSFSGNNDYSGNTFGGSNSFGGSNDYSGNTFGGNNDYSGNTFGGNNDYSGNTFGGDNSYSGNTFGGSNTFGGNNSFGGDDNYDPNAPLYHPEPMTYDPNAPLYRPENNTPVSSYSSSAVKTQKTPVQSIAIVALFLAVAVVVGIVCYKVFFDKKNLKEYFDTREGQSNLEMLKTGIAGSEDVKDAKVYVEGDDVLVYDITYNVASVTNAEKALWEKTIELSEPTFRSEIKKIMDKEKIKSFSVRFLFRLSNGEEIVNYKISP